jgi:hypothetical protein
VTLTVTDNAGLTTTLTNQVMVGTLPLPTPLVGSDAVSVNAADYTGTISPDAQVNDVAFAMLSISDIAPSVTAPEGWELLDDQQTISLRTRVYWKVVGPGDIGSAHTFTSTTQKKGDLTIAVFRGVNTESPVLAYLTSTETENRGSHYAPELAFAGPATVMHYWADRNAVTSRITAPAGKVTLETSIGTGSGKVAAVLALEPVAQSGSSAAAVAVADEATKNALGLSLALNPFTTPDLTPINGSVERVVHVSIDGLGSQWVNAQLTPNLMTLVANGTSTLNARTDSDNTETIPNHTSQLTGRPVLGTGGHGVDFDQWDDQVETTTVHDFAGEYAASVFDVVHDNGLRTAGFVSRSRLNIFDLTWSDNGAPDTTGADNGTDKIDVWDKKEPDVVMDLGIAELIENGTEYTFLHLKNPDVAGRAFNWDSAEYQAAVQDADALLGELLDAIAGNANLAGTTAVIVTSDHGGEAGENDHDDPTEASNFTIPFVYWGPTVGQGVDMYADEVGVRTDPGLVQIPNNGGAVAEPIRTHDAGNLALELLGLSGIPRGLYSLGAFAESECPASMPLGDLDFGVAASDNATGIGYLMWSNQDVHVRFSPPPYSRNADHLIAVQYVNGQWMVDNNSTLTAFTPAADDCLVAEVNFTNDTAVTLQGTDTIINGIDAGYTTGDLAVFADQLNGNPNNGEFDVTGTQIES